MDKVHEVTRPPWALDWLDSWLGLFSAIALSTTATHELTDWFHKTVLQPHIDSRQITEVQGDWLLDAVITVVLFLICRIAILGYKKLKTYRYPGSYVYCFKRVCPTTKARKEVIGHFILDCRPDGSMFAHGASYDWVNNALDYHSRVGWQSQHVGATRGNGAVTCFILYNVNDDDEFRRPYKHGLLRFEKKNLEFGVVAREQVYVGNMQAVDPPKASVAVYANTYAERIGKEKSEAKLTEILQEFGAKLLGHQKGPGWEA